MNECQLCGAMVQERARIHLHSEATNSVRLVCSRCGERYIEQGQACLVTDMARYAVTYVETSRTTKTGEVFATHDDEAQELAEEKYGMPFRDDGDSDSWEVTVKEVERDE